MPFTGRPRPERPALRPAYQGSNPVSDIWSLEAMRMCRDYLVRARRRSPDEEARANMLLAASYAGMGFGNAGVHLPHGMSYRGVGEREELSSARLRDGSCAGAARHVGDPERAGRVPLYRRAPIPLGTSRPREALGADVSRARADDAGKFSPTGSPGSCSA